MEVGKVFENKIKEQKTEAKDALSLQTEEPKEVSIFQIANKTMVGKSIQDKADKNLNSIADYIIEKAENNISLTKTIGVFGMSASLLTIFAKNLLFKSPTKLSTGLAIGIIALGFATIAGLVELLGGKEKRKANYTKFAAQTKDKSAIELSLAPKAESDFLEKTGKVLLSASATDTLSQKTIAKNAATSLGKDNVRTRGIYFVDSKNDNQKAENLLIVDAKINSDEYDGLSEKGIQKNSYELPVEYSDFIKKYMGSKKLTKEQADKFIEIVKALQTDGIYSKKQAPQNHDGRKEDIEIFDISKDGKINYGDIVAAQLYEKIKGNVFSEQEISAFNDINNWEADKLFNILGKDKYTQADIVDELFDLNGDGNIDEKDFHLYQKTKENIENFDINADGKIDNNDAKLAKLYVKGFIDRYNNKGAFLKNFVDITGGEDNIKILEEYFEEENLKQQLEQAS